MLITEIQHFSNVLIAVFENPIFHPFNLLSIDYQEVNNLEKGVETVLETVSSFFFIKNFVELDNNEAIKPFRLATLSDCKGDVTKRWCISFWAWDGIKNKMVRKRLYEINQYKTEAERRAYATRYIKELNRRLKAGLHLNNVKAEAQTEPRFKSYNIITALEYALDLIKATKRHETYLSYNSDVNAFKSFLKIENLESLTVNQFKKEKVYLFIDYLQVNRKLSNVTVNNKLACLKSLFNKLEERAIIDNNPFVKVKNLKKIITNKNMAYSPVQVLDLKKDLQENEPYLWFFVEFIYYTYIRPAELRRLKVGNIDFEKGKITIPADVSKNKNLNTLSLPLPLQKKLLELKINTYNKDFYLFTAKREPSFKPLSKNYMSLRHKNILDLKEFGDNFTLYSWKHTGVVSAYKSGIDIKSIQLQCRHASIEQTDHYLKTLGFEDNKAIMNIPEL